MYVCMRSPMAVDGLWLGLWSTGRLQTQVLKIQPDHDYSVWSSRTWAVAEYDTIFGFSWWYSRRAHMWRV